MWNEVTETFEKNSQPVSQEVRSICLSVGALNNGGRSISAASPQQTQRNTAE